MVDLTPTAGDGLLSYGVDAARLRSFTMKELIDLREAMVLIADIVMGQAEQPRYQRPKTCLYNAPGDVLDALHVITTDIADKIEDEAAARTDGLSAGDEELRAWLLIRAQAERGDDLGKVCQIAANGRA